MSRELLDHLRLLNELARVLRRTDLTATQRRQCETKVSGLRSKLPTALLIQHDRVASDDHDSVAAIAGSSCGSCHLKLPLSLISELHQPGRIEVCPHCGVFVFNDTPAPAAAPSHA